MPHDYRIYREIGLIDINGDQNFDKINKKNSKDSSETENEELNKYLTSDEKFINMVQHYAHKMIIRKDNPFYQLEQFLLTFLCLISSYMYAYIACF